jgi:hypothetical protein
MHGVVFIQKYIHHPGDNLMHVRKLNDFCQRLPFIIEHQNFVQSIEQLADNKIISASYDGTIRVWEI